MPDKLRFDFSNNGEPVKVLWTTPVVTFG
jgi:hypothetical protein